MLVSKEPPAPADGSQDTGHDRGQEGGLSLDWAVPNVRVKDVRDFEQLSPELEAGTAPSFMHLPTYPVPCTQGPGGRDPVCQICASESQVFAHGPGKRRKY